MPAFTRPGPRRRRTTPLTALAATAATLIAAFAVPAPAHALTAVDFYVSPSGSDSNAGTSASSPFKTLAKAQSAVRAVDQADSGQITVYLAGGTYRLTSTLAFTSADSGTVDDIWWRAESGAAPVVSGAKQITGWTEHDAAHDIWQAPAPAGVDTRQLYVNGVRASRAGGALPVSVTQTATGYTTAAGDPMASWGNQSEIDFDYSGGLGAWTDPSCPVASITGTAITMAQPCWNNSTKRVLRTDGSGRTVELVGRQSVTEAPTAVENAYALLTKPGQWYLDRSSDTVYYIPLSGQSMAAADVEMPVLQTLVSLTGTASAEVHSIGFQGIQFSYAGYPAPDTGTGFSEIQANYTITGTTGYATQGLCTYVSGGTCPYGNWTKLPGNVTAGYDHNIHFDHDYFVHLGAAGLDLGDGSRDDTVTACVFTDISGNGLELGGVDVNEPSSTQQDTSGDVIKDSHFYNIADEYHGGVAILVGYVETSTLQNNQIDDIPYTGISIGWGGWPDKVDLPAEPNYSNGNVISDNLIYDLMETLGDGGGIYTNGITGGSLADGEQVTGNLVHDSVSTAGHEIYTDNGASYITITGNGEYDVGSNAWGSNHTNYTLDNGTYDPLQIENNYWPSGPADYDAKSVLIEDNTNITGASQIPSSLVSAAGIQSPYTSVLSWQPAQ
ncbi:MAG TPA: right-handed parallel beta-helix repeat-containing protein [Actinocrinis sp.]